MSEEDTRAPGKSDFICPQSGCNKVFSRHNRLIVHLRTHTGERPFVCDVTGCSKSYARAAHLNRHKHVTHNASAVLEKFKCTKDGCIEEFSTKQNLKRHIKRKHEHTRYECPEEGCMRSFLKHQHLKVHLTEHTGVNSFRCHHEDCGKSFQIPSRLKRHLKTHLGYPCKAEGCGATFTKWTLLRKHVAQEHASAHTCPECNKVFSQKQWLRVHMKTHQESRDMYMCPRENCGRSYLDQRNLAAHIRSYHDGIKFPCTFPGCDRKFATEQKQKQHLKVHDPNRLPKPKIKKSKKSVLAKVFSCKFDKQEVDTENDTDKLLTVSYSDIEEMRKNQEEIQTLFTEIQMVSGTCVKELTPNVRNVETACGNEEESGEVGHLSYLEKVHVSESMDIGGELTENLSLADFLKSDQRYLKETDEKSIDEGFSESFVST